MLFREFDQPVNATTQFINLLILGIQLFAGQTFHALYFLILMRNDLPLCVDNLLEGFYIVVDINIANLVIITLYRLPCNCWISPSENLIDRTV